MLCRILLSQHPETEDSDEDVPKIEFEKVRGYRDSYRQVKYFLLVQAQIPDPITGISFLLVDIAIS
jgi:hypothetical protein